MKRARICRSLPLDLYGVSFHAAGIASLAVFLFAAAVPPGAHADFTVGRNLAFNAGGKNPWRPGDAYVWDPDPYTLLDVKNAHVDFGPLNADPAEALLDLLGSVLGVEIPDFGLVKLKVGGTVSGNAYVGFDLYADAGRLAVNYPGHADLNLEANGNQVTSRQTYSIGSSFQPGLNVAYQIPAVVKQGVFAGPGYSGPPQVWGQIAHTSYSQPTFSTYRPDFNARLIAEADVHAGAYGSVSALWGRFKGRKTVTVNADVGGTIIEVDPTGLYVYGNDMGVFDLTQPIDIPIPGVGTARVALPLPAVNGAPNAPNSNVLHGEYIGEVLRLDTDVEKLVPFIGSILHNSLPPLLTPYDLAHIGLAPKISLYQDLTFTPDPRVRLKFSELVRANGVITNVAEFALGQDIQWTPIFSNSSQITIVPEYIMRNSFRHETGLALDVDVTFDALGFDSAFVPDYVGPLVHETSTFEVARFPLYEPAPWEIELNSVFGTEIPLSKYNAAPGLQDVHLTVANLISGNPNNPATFELQFERAFEGQPPHQFQLTVPGFYTKLDVENPGGEAYVTHVFTADNDVVFIDPVTSEQFNLGRDFGLFNSTNLSGLLPDPSPALLVEDPNNPGQFLPELFIPYLEEIPYTPPDIENDPILGAPTIDQISDEEQIEYGPDVVDQRNGSATTVLVQSIDLVPEGDAEFGPLPKAFINSSGAVAVKGSLELFSAGEPGGPGLYLATETDRDKLGRPGDPVAGGGTVEFNAVNPAFLRFREVNDNGTVAFHAGGNEITAAGAGIYRGSAAGIEAVARHGQAAPAGDKYLYMAGIESPVAINQNDDVAFTAFLSNQPGVYQFDLPTAVYRSDGQSLIEIARVGQAAPIPSGQPFLTVGALDINDSGEVAFGAGTNGSSSLSVFRGNGTSMVAIAATQSSVAPGWAFDSSIGYAKINNAGQVAFFGSVYQPGIGNFKTGVYRGDGGPLAEIVRVGFAAPDLDGDFSSINISMPLGFNEAGQVAFLATVAGGANYNGVFASNGAALQRIARSGQAAPDGDGTFQSFATAVGDEVQLNNHGHLAFHSTLSGTANDQGLFLYDGTNTVQIARNGQLLAGSTITSLGAPSLNDEMQVAYVAQLADGRQVAARFEPQAFWSNAGGGPWSTGTNWSLGVEPTNPYDVFVVAENALTVTGPAVSRTVKSLTIGGQDAANVALELASGATLTATNGTTVFSGGVLGGYGGLAGDLTSSGVIRVGGMGAAPTTGMSIAGDATLVAGGKLQIDIQGTTPGSQFDQLNVAGQLTLGGTLEVALVNFNPALGNSFDILNAANIVGTFDALQLPSLGPDLMWQLSQLYSTGVLRVALAGDFNLDGTVNAADYVVWRKTNGSPDDYATWQTNFARTLFPSSGAGTTGSVRAPTVPEPAACVLVAIGLGGVIISRHGPRYGDSCSTQLFWLDSGQNAT